MRAPAPNAGRRHGVRAAARHRGGRRSEGGDAFASRRSSASGEPRGDPARATARGGNRTFTLGRCARRGGSDRHRAIAAIRAWRGLPDALAPGASAPAETWSRRRSAFPAGREAVHLRFLVGTAIAGPAPTCSPNPKSAAGASPSRSSSRASSRTDGVSVLVLPRAPQRLLPAVSTGRAAQREVSAQLFASNAIRRFRGSVGEPSAVISAHRAPDAPGGGELRLSLSSPFEPHAAEGFRCPLYPLDRVGDVVTMLVELLARLPGDRHSRPRRCSRRSRARVPDRRCCSSPIRFRIAPRVTVH